VRRTPSLIIVGLVVMLACAGGVVAYDGARSDTIAKGIEIGHVDVGGLSADAGRARLRARMLKPLRRPLVVVAGERRFALSAREAHITADVESMISAAVERGREGSILTRTWRGLTGGEVHARVAPRVAYSQIAVRRLVDRVRVAMTRKPVEADIAIAGERIALRRSVAGLAVDPRRLRAKVERALGTDAGDGRRVRADLRPIRPKVTTEHLAQRYPVVLMVDRAGFRISLFKRLKRVRTYRIAVGQAGLETPAGRYTIQSKAVDPAWHVPNSPWAGSLAGTVIPGGAPDNPLKARWLGVYDGVGVPGTDARGSIGTNASHGCIRMLVEDVTKLYDEVPVGSPIFID
jgi:lipoprotein-anchoring transpeptidase ErfK/SrfK